MMSPTIRIPAPGTRAGLPRARRACACTAAAALLALAAGCGTLPRNGTPVDLMPRAQIAGMPDVRATGGVRSDVMTADLARSFAEESATDFPVAADGLVHYAHLALSGGGANGAFGAGVLSGWTNTGTRPVFKIVTGVSTGALMAPFAFLGSDYDYALRDFYTTNASNNIFRRLSILPSLLGGESLADTGPLRDLIDANVDERILAAVAAGHRAGRRLYIGTVDLDSQRFIVWNMGLIATSGSPRALELFRKVMLASAAIPLAFPPVFFDVEVDGARYDEMHVDGAVVSNVFYTAGVFSFAEVRNRYGRAPGREDIYLIHNGRLVPQREVTRRSLPSIAVRSFESATTAAMFGTLFRIHTVAVNEHAGFGWITVPAGVDLTGTETFDPVLMKSLYELGQELGGAGPQWATDVPVGKRRSRQLPEAVPEPVAPAVELEMEP